jgi:hypothetical protein
MKGATHAVVDNRINPPLHLHLNTRFSEIYQPLFEPVGRFNAQKGQLIFSRS